MYVKQTVIDGCHVGCQTRKVVDDINDNVYLRLGLRRLRLPLGAVHKEGGAGGGGGGGVSVWLNVTERYMGVGGYLADRYVTLIFNFIYLALALPWHCF